MKVIYARWRVRSAGTTILWEGREQNAHSVYVIRTYRGRFDFGGKEGEEEGRGNAFFVFAPNVAKNSIYCTEGWILTFNNDLFVGFFIELDRPHIPLFNPNPNPIPLG
eukprot:GEMP01057808.1.p1 GENE.GEMP01057808.1~~GEMP01057808.1.p1  ORF type:complete len:108 (+),score=3.39 GEMP01057808.1:594-917(+)